MSVAGEVHDGVHAVQRFVPIGCRKVADDRGAGPDDSGSHVTHRDDARDAQRRQMPAQRSADESVRAGDKDLAANLRRHSHFQPCLLKNRAALRRK